MTFELRLKFPKPMMVTRTWAREYDPELDDVGSLLRDVCDALESGGASFVVRICSDTVWPVTVRTDLMVVLEQLAAVLAALANRQPAKLEFYEQGIEKVVSLVPHRQVVLVECSDLIKQPSSEVVSATVDRVTVFDELCLLSSEFLSGSKACCGNLTGHPWFVAFADELRRNARLARASRFTPWP